MSAITAADRDSLGRPLRDLRISVTDRCNFRCTYCMPKEVFGRNFHFLPSAELLSFEEIARLARIFVAHGVEKLRLTGGEPLLRNSLEKLIAMLVPLEGLKDLALTTNGSLLAKKADSLKAAGLHRISVSLDSLDDEVCKAMNGVDFPVRDVLTGIEAALSAGLHPVKINVVVRRGVNDHTLLELARRFHGSPCIVRFIEYMDVGSTNGWEFADVLPAAEIVKLIDSQLPLEPIAPSYSGEVAQRYRYKDGAGEIGIIASVTQPFCGDCSRARLSSQGMLYTCLFASAGHDLRALLRSGKSDAQVFEFIGALWRERADRYSEMRSARALQAPKIEMSYIGG